MRVIIYDIVAVSTGYAPGDVLIERTTGTRTLVVQDGRGVCLVPAPVAPAGARPHGTTRAHVLEVLGHGPTRVDTVAAAIWLSRQRVQLVLQELREEGLVTSEPGDRVARGRVAAVWRLTRPA